MRRRPVSWVVPVWPVLPALLVTTVLVGACQPSTVPAAAPPTPPTPPAAPATPVPPVSPVSPPARAPGPLLARLVRLLPRPDLTPGATDPRVTQADVASTICVVGYTRTVRPPQSYTDRVKVQVLAAYGIYDNPFDYELDHLIPLELGGAPADVRNLWPQPWEDRGARRAPLGQGAESKDRLESLLHRRVCSGELALVDAQQQIAADWQATGLRVGLG